MYAALEEQCILSRKAIADLEGFEGFEGLVQGLLKANWGMDWDEFWRIVDWNCRHPCRGDWKMVVPEERAIVLGVIGRWLGRAEVRELSVVMRCVEALREFLQ
jgi:hypothetical protein